MYAPGSGKAGEEREGEAVPNGDTRSSVVGWRLCVVGVAPPRVDCEESESMEKKEAADEGSRFPK